MKNYEPYEGKEDDLQQICARYLAYSPDIFYCHVPNGGKRNAREAAKFKRMGVRAGIPDLLIFNPSGHYNGLAIELKVKGGKVRPSQKEALERLNRLGWCTKVVYSFDQFEHIINVYFKL